MDPEKQVSSDFKLLDGFPKVAAWSSVASTNDVGTDIYKAFHKSSTRNLLYLQSQVAALEKLQTLFDEEDYRCRVKDWDSSYENLEEGDILERYFQPSVKVIDDLKIRLQVLELVEGRVKAWELLHSKATGQSAGLTAVDTTEDIGKTYSDSPAQPASVKLASIHLQTHNELLNKSTGELARGTGSTGHRTQHDHINQSTREGNSRSNMLSELAETDMKIKPKIKHSMYRFGRREESNKDPIEEPTTFASEKQSWLRYRLSAFNDDYAIIHTRIKRLEKYRNNPSSILPHLPQNLFWGPVSDRGPSIISGVPEDFILHKECIYQSSASSPCICYESYRELEKDFEKEMEISDGPYRIQIFQQRIRVLEDYYRDLETKELRGTGLLDNVLLGRTQPSLAIILAARSWEDFEIFGSAEKMWERRRCWDHLERGKPWPFDMSDEWIGKMRKRFQVTRDLQLAIKEYHKALRMQAQIALFQQPATRSIRSIAHRHNKDRGRGIRQFHNSSHGLYDEPSDLIQLDSSSHKEPYLIRRLSNSFSTGIFQRFFLNKKLSKSNERYVSETRVATTVTIIVLIYLIALLVMGTWMVKLIGDRIAGGVTSEEFGTITNQQLGVLTAFTVAFSVFTLLLGASRWEAFASTAAYAAVMVIFMAPVPPNVMPVSL